MQARTCRRCERTTLRKSGLCWGCEREEQRAITDAQRGFSIDWGEFVRLPGMSVMGRSDDDAPGGSL